MTTHDHLTPAQIDHFRSGLVAADQAESIRRHLAQCPRCQEELRFGERVCAHLALLPQLAAWLPQRRPRAVRWPRVFAAGMATASLALAVFISVPHFGANHANDLGNLSPQIADAVQNIEFYQWLSNHPQVLQQRLQNDNPA
jgi:anti-sigma factor RsiW